MPRNNKGKLCAGQTRAPDLSMSEYQYYEFVAVDQPLTSKQQAELRKHSSRATITASSFISRIPLGQLQRRRHRMDATVL